MRLFKKLSRTDKILNVDFELFKRYLVEKNTNKVFEAACVQQETVIPVGVDLGPSNSATQNLKTSRIRSIF